MPAHENLERTRPCPRSYEFSPDLADRRRDRRDDLIVSHNINLARTVSHNIGMLFRRHLVMFGPREVLLTSEEPVVKQFLCGARQPTRMPLSARNSRARPS